MFSPANVQIIFYMIKFFFKKLPVLVCFPCDGHPIRVSIR